MVHDGDYPHSAPGGVAGDAGAPPRISARAERLLRPQSSVGRTQGRVTAVAHWSFGDPHRRELGGRLLELAGANVVSDSQSVDV